MVMVTVRYWAAAKQAAGVEAEELAAGEVGAGTLADALDAAVARREAGPEGGRPGAGSALAAVLARSSFLIDGEPVGRRAAGAVPLRDGAVIEVLPPFAGG